jgi:hypothetical protein
VKLQTRSRVAWLVVASLLFQYPVVYAQTRPPLPPLTTENQATVARNEILAKLAKTHPTILRKILGMIAVLNSDTRMNGSADRQGPDEPKSAAAAENHRETIAINSAKNPDLNRLYGSSPEARYDLLQLLKQAGFGLQGKQPTGK